MIALQITSMKEFMNHLLAGTAFDIFLLEEATITTSNTYHIDGHMNRDFYTEEELEDLSLCPYEFASWSQMKGLCFQLIKGKRTPLFFKFVLHLMPSHAEALLKKEECSVDINQLKSLVLTIKYSSGTATLTTGSSYHTFLLTKEPDQIWDKALTHFLDKHGIPYEIL